jgi:hypothetical protein
MQTSSHQIEHVFSIAALFAEIFYLILHQMVVRIVAAASVSRWWIRC